MSVRTIGKKSLRSTVIPVAAGLVAAGVGALPAAQAAGTSPARPAAPALHGSPPIPLGSTTNPFKNIFTEGPDGTVFYSKGSVVYVVKGGALPKIALHAGGQVQALAANSTDLFVEAGLTVTDYSRTNGAAVRHWTLSSAHTITIAALIVVGHTLWSETDWGTGDPGPATISRIVTTASLVHIVDRKGKYGPVAADSTGLYFTDAPTPTTVNLVHDSPTGTIRRHSVPGSAVGASMALAGSNLELLYYHGSRLYLNNYSPTSLQLLSAAPVSNRDRMIAGTGLGLLVLSLPCNQLTCSASTVSKLAPSGLASGTLVVPYAFPLLLLTGPSAAVVKFAAGKLYLVRIIA